MRSSYEVTTSAVHPNAFSQIFLHRLGERDEPPTAGDADVAGPWRIEPSLAWLLEAAGAVALERCGAILDERTATAEAVE